MTQKQYNEMLIECKKIAFKVYAINREENRFLKNTFLMKMSKFVWIFCIISVIILFWQKDYEINQQIENMLQLLFSITIGLVFIVSVLNYTKIPPQNIFINYEKFLR